MTRLLKLTPNLFFPFLTSSLGFCSHTNNHLNKMPTPSHHTTHGMNTNKHMTRYTHKPHTVEDMGGRDDLLGGAARDLSTSIARRLASASGARSANGGGSGGVSSGGGGQGGVGGGSGGGSSSSGGRTRHGHSAGDREDSPLQSKRSSTFFCLCLWSCFSGGGLRACEIGRITLVCV